MKGWIRNLYHRLLSVYRYTVMFLFSAFPLSDTVVFSSYRGQYFNDNPLCIYQEFLKRNLPFKYVWLMKDPATKIEGAKVIKEGSISALFYLATSRVWVDNCRKKGGTRKRNGQYYVQTWHGDIAIKKVEKDAIDTLRSYYVEAAKNDSRIADLFISGSKWRTSNYRSAFWYSGEILESGTPKSDIYFVDNTDVVEKVYDFYKISRDTKLILYAPTFRSDGDLSCYNINFSSLLAKLANRNDKWIAIVRLHPNVSKKHKLIQYSQNVMDGSIYPSINELIIACKVLITDYSSCMFDGLEAGKRVVLYASDIDKYLDDRGLYMRFDELPFSLCTNNEELERTIVSFDEQNYRKKIEEFKHQLGYINDGHGAERVVDRIISDVSKKKSR